MKINRLQDAELVFIIKKDVFFQKFELQIKFQIDLLENMMKK